MQLKFTQCSLRKGSSSTEGSETKICFWLAYFPSHERGHKNLTNQDVLCGGGGKNVACFTSGWLGFLGMRLSCSGQMGCAVEEGREEEGRKENEITRRIERQEREYRDSGGSVPRSWGFLTGSSDVLNHPVIGENDTHSFDFHMKNTVGWVTACSEFL